MNAEATLCYLRICQRSRCSSHFDYRPLRSGSVCYPLLAVLGQNTVCSNPIVNCEFDEGVALYPIPCHLDADRLMNRKKSLSLIGSTVSSMANKCRGYFYDILLTYILEETLAKRSVYILSGGRVVATNLFLLATPHLNGLYVSSSRGSLIYVVTKGL